MKKDHKIAIVLGATGLTGSHLLSLLLNDDRYEKILLFSRSSVGLAHQKLTEHLGDLMQLQQFADDFEADEVFCCIGTTKSKTPNKEAYKNIDYGIPVSVAQLCKQKGITTCIIVSALGADAKSPIFYNRVKGQMEEAVLALRIPKTHLLQPSLIGGDRAEKRLGEGFFKQLMKVVNPILIGGLAKYRSVHPGNIAKCMVWLANHGIDQKRISSDEINRIAEG